MIGTVTTSSIGRSISGTWRGDTARMGEVGRALVVLGALIVIIGLVLVLFDRVPWIGRLPGDILVHRGNWTFYFPLGTSILLSLVLTLVLWLVGRQ